MVFFFFFFSEINGIIVRAPFHLSRNSEKASLTEEDFPLFREKKERRAKVVQNLHRRNNEGGCRWVCETILRRANCGTMVG